ncbi:hypothetical protein MTO96_051181 [Rhipicephalus appendiculatus]
MPPRTRRAPRDRGREKTQQSTPSVGEETPQTVQQEPPASTSRGRGRASVGLKASAGQQAPDEQATPSLPPEQSLADCSDGEQHEGMPVPKLPLKRRRGQPPKTKKVAPKQSNVGAPGSSRNPPAALPNEEIQAASPPVNLSQLHVVDNSAASSGAKEMENTRITRSLSKSLEDPHIRKCTVSMGVCVSVRAKGEVREKTSGAAAEGLGTKKRAKRRDSLPVAQREVAVTSAAHSSSCGDTSQARNVSAYSSFLMPPGPIGQQRVTRALSKLRTEKGPTNETSEEIHRNVRTVGSVSDQPALSCGAVTKTPRVHQQGKTLDAPGSRTDETDLKAGPSSSRLSYRRRLLFEKDALENSTLEKGTRNVEVKTRTSKHQLTSDDAAKASGSTLFHGGQGDAETSSPARKKGSTGEKPARAVPQGVSKNNVSAQPPPERRRSKRLSAETCAEAGPSGDKTARTQKSSQEMPHSLGITSSDQQHASGSSHSRSRESRRQAEGRGNSPHTEHVPESRAGTKSQASQQRTEREKLRARPRHLWQRKTAQEPVFIVEDREPTRHAPSPISRSKADATLSLSPAPLSVASSSDEGYAGKLGFHWYEATFGALQRGRTDAADDEIESLHWKSDTEEYVSENDSSDVDSGEDLSVLPWDNDSRSTQFSKDLEPSQKMQRLDRWQKDARKRVQARLLGVRVTNRAWDTIDKWHSHFLENMGQSVQAMAERVGHNQIEEEDVVWFIHRHLGTADPMKLWALADKLLPAELRDQIYPATKCNLASNDA